MADDEPFAIVLLPLWKRLHAVMRRRETWFACAKRVQPNHYVVWLWAGGTDAYPVAHVRTRKQAQDIAQFLASLDLDARVRVIKHCWLQPLVKPPL